jgi:hypothetical protein
MPKTVERGRRAACVASPRASGAASLRRHGLKSCVPCGQVDAKACGGGGGGSDGSIALSPVRSTPWRDPGTRGAMPRAGLRRHALAARLADLLLNTKPPEKAAPKIARLGPPQAKKKPPQARRRRKKIWRGATANTATAAAHAPETRSWEGREIERQQSGKREHDETSGQ